MPKTPIVFREAGIDPTQDEIPLKRASLRPLMGCAGVILILCVGSFLAVAGISYMNGRRAAEAALITLEATEEATPEVTAEFAQEATPEVTTEFTQEVTATPSQTITPTPLVEYTEEPAAGSTQFIPVNPSSSGSRDQPRVVTRYLQDTVYVTVPPRVVTREVIIQPPPDVIIITATYLPTNTPQPEITSEVTPEITPEITEDATSTPSETPTLTQTPTATETATATSTATMTATFTATTTLTPTYTPTPTDTPTVPTIFVLATPLGTENAFEVAQ